MHAPSQALARVRPMATATTGRTKLPVSSIIPTHRLAWEGSFRLVATAVSFRDSSWGDPGLGWGLRGRGRLYICGPISGLVFRKA